MDELISVPVELSGIYDEVKYGNINKIDIALSEFAHRDDIINIVVSNGSKKT